ncbi:MAG: hypothetical protein J0L84_17155, partial [Verrucomicrobia bacterium]|nr:hypothetical protein [Verrucomicrobiota bacterium]
EEERVLLAPPLDAIRDVMFSADSSVLAYSRRSDPAGPPAGNPWQVWAMAVASGNEKLISATPSGTHGAGNSREPQVSADGRFIVYRTEAADVVPGGNGPTQEIVVHDRYLGVTRRLSVPADGGVANNRSSRPEISGDGRTAAFSSAASNLVPGDHNGLEDVFVISIPSDPAPDADQDGLPDGWEEDQFGSRARDGAGDADGDGSSDAEEWSVRTAPTDTASRWQVRLESTEASRSVHWRGAAGMAYQVERADTLAAGNWLPVGSPVAGYEGIMSAALDGEVSGGFFRVVASRP